MGNNLSTFKKLVIGWIVLFTALVIYALISIKHEASTRKSERDSQLALLATAGHDECVKAFQAMTNILRISIPPKEIKSLTEKKRKLVVELFQASNPKTNCPPPGVNGEAIKKMREGE